MVHRHVRRCRSCIPLYDAIASQEYDRQTSVGPASRRPDAKIVIRNVGPLFQDLGITDRPASHLSSSIAADRIHAMARYG
jgi:hypothetical protein